MPQNPPSTAERQRTELDTRAAAKRLGVAPETLERWRQLGIGPRWSRLGRKLVRYSEESLDEFVLSGHRTSTSDRREEYPTRPTKREEVRA
jgi:Helix-turn-helix domain